MINTYSDDVDEITSRAWWPQVQIDRKVHDCRTLLHQKSQAFSSVKTESDKSNTKTSILLLDVNSDATVDSL
mgnify:CR=1 FL=1